MAAEPGFKLFGSRRRTQILEILGLLGESFPAEIARLLDARLFSIQQILDALETEGVVVSRKLGVERRVSLNPRFPASKELTDLIKKMARYDSPLIRALESRRARPRKRSKPL